MAPQLGVDGGPERLFGFEPLYVDGRRTGGSMATGQWMAGPGGIPRAGALGVMVDNALGTTISAQHPDGRWAVSTEIAMDLVRPIPADGSVVRATVGSIEVDAIGAFATGDVIDATGNVIARCRQRGRFIPTPAPTTTNGWHDVRPDDDADLLSRIAAVTSLAHDGDDLELLSAPALANPMGNLHGGVSLCVSEWTGALALSRTATPLTTASVHIAHLRPIPIGTRVRFTTNVIHTGRGLGVVHVTSLNDAGKPCTVTTLVTH